MTKLKRTAGFITSLAMLFSSVSFTAFADNTDNSDDVVMLEIVPDNSLDGYTIKGEENLNIIPTPYAENVGVSAQEDIPTYYNLKEQGKVTAVKNQGTANVCWAFSTLGAVEQNLILKGYENASVDLSETDLIWFSNTLYGDNRGSTTTDVYNVTSVFSPILALTRDSGIEYDEFEPYFYKNQKLSVVSSVQKNLMEYRLDNMQIIKNDSQQVKKAIMENGNAETTYYSSNDYYTEDGENYYYAKDSGTSVNHSVTVVGWDDNYSKDNFLESARPENDGAWLVKSSWGSEKNNGFYWISYDEAEMTTFYSFDMCKNDETDKTYTYTNGTARGYLYATNEIYGANVFAAQRNETLKKVSFFVNENDCLGTDYTVTVYKDLVDNSPIGKTVASTFSGRKEISGYYTVDIPDEVTLAEGEKYSVVISLKNDNGKNYLLTEAGSDKAESNLGESYYSTSGKDWLDCSEKGYDNVYINALTAVNEVDKNELKLIYSDYENTVGMSRSLAYAKNILDNENASQTDVNNAVALIKAEAEEKENYIVIRSVADWNAFAQALNNSASFEGYTILVEKDLNFDNREFVVAGSYEYEFDGFFDGCGHTFSNISFDTTADEAGVFGGLSSYADVRNLIVRNSSMTGAKVGGIAGESSAANISGCGFYGSVDAAVSGGGIVGEYRSGTVSNCYFVNTTNESTTSAFGSVINNYSTFDNIYTNTESSELSGITTVENSKSTAYMLNTNGGANNTSKLWTLDENSVPVRTQSGEYASSKIDFELGNITSEDYTNYLGKTEFPKINGSQGVTISWLCDEKAVDETTAFDKDSTVIGTAADSYFITYQLDGGINSEDNYDIVYTGDSFELADPVKDGFAFKGWYLNANFTGEAVQSVANPTSDVTLYALFEVNRFTVNFYGENEILLDTQTVESGNAAVEPTDIPQVDGKYFDGWDKTFDSITEDTDVHAVYTECVDVQTADIAGFEESVTYTGEEITQTSMVLTSDEKALEEGTDYTVEYADNRNCGTATVTISGIGKFKGTAVKTFEIEPASVSEMEAVLSKTEYTYDGSEKTPDITMGSLVKDTDFTVAYENNTEIGTATVIITGIGNYCGEQTKEFTIIEYAENDINRGNIPTISAQSYLGIEITPLMTITFNGRLLLKGRDYTVSYSDNVEIGTATATIKGIGKYTGVAVRTFEIAQRKSATVNKPRIIGRQSNPYTAVATWVPDFTVNGSELMYADNSDFTGGKTLTVEGYGANFIAVLNNNRDKVNGYDNTKTLYVKVRSFIYVDGKKVYSQWSDTRTINPYVK